MCGPMGSFAIKCALYRTWGRKDTMIVELTALLADGTAPAPAPGSGTGMDTLIFLVAPLALFVLFIVMPMRREARVRKSMLGLLKKGDRVLINGFMIGNVVQIIKPEN